MSLTSQLKDKNSPVRRFFSEFEDINGAKECLSLLQSALPINPSLLPVSASVSSYAYVGTTMDYLIRYMGCNNSLDFDKAIAGNILHRRGYDHLHEDYYDNLDNLSLSQYLRGLFRIGKKYLDGRAATDCKVVYAATALSVMDGVLRSGFLPKLFATFYFDDNKDLFFKDNHMVEDQVEIMTGLVLDQYIESLGGEAYIQDVLSLVDIFLRYRDDVNGDFFGAELTVGNRVLRNSRLVGGADFDCIFKCKGKLILTDVKTTIKPLKLEYLRQIIGYALLYNEDLDSFKFTDIGIYHSRSGSFRYLSLDGVVKKALPSLNSIVQARQEFIGFIEKDRLKKLEELKKVQAEQEALRAIELAKKESLKEKRKIARLAKAEAIKNGTYEIGEQELIRLKKAEEKRKIEIIKQERKLASNEKRKIARLAKAEVIKNGTYEIGEQELILAKEKLRVMEQERALAKEKLRLGREKASIARANKRRESERRRREKAAAIRLARRLNQDAENSK